MSMHATLKMVCWRGERFWLGKLVDHPEIMTQGETLEELEENLRDAYREMLFEDVPPDYQILDMAL
jgi:predicted RNase H-like HicB family nuclease